MYYSCLICVLVASSIEDVRTLKHLFVQLLSPLLEVLLALRLWEIVRHNRAL
jgi:hypothetical protein